MRLLLVEDDRETSAFVTRALEERGYDVETSFSGTDGLARAEANDYDVLVIDRMLPELDGLSLVRRLRTRGSRVPVLFLTTMSGLDDRVAGLEGGGDDYLPKPFATAELVARVNALARRTAGEATQLSVLDLKIDLLRRTVQRAGRPIVLQQQEFLLLEYLVRNAGRVVTRTMLLENVWDLQFDPRTNIVETHMSRLRSKVDRGFEVELIHTVRGAGYVLRAD
ncbi:MAG TPA: response regulator transcription factor [Rhizomicrobium sp.]|nr:response regulator transcription factor [Rhizomicrobium sp.]